MVRIIPNRLKSHNGKPGSQAGSRSSSPMRTPPSDQKGLVLRTTVIKGRNLAAKDKSGTSDPFLVVNLGESGQSTPTITKTLNPEWNVSFDLPITGPKDLLLEATCWDKDRFSNDYMGEFDVAVEDVFGNGKVTQQPRWYPLKGHGKTKKKKSEISGEVQIQFTLADTSDPSASPQDLLQKLAAFTTVEGDDDSVDDDEALAQMDSLDLEDEDDADDKETGTSDETDNLTKEEKVEKKKRKLRMKRLRRKTKARAYEFTGGTDVVGIVFLEVTKITDLPPERNMTRTSFDMDPFVVTSLGRKTYRTRVIRHNLNPVFEEKMVFQVMRHEQNYSMSFAVVDRDKLSGNDFVGTVNLPLSNLTMHAPEADPDTGLYSLPDPSDPTATAMPQKTSRFRLPLSRSASATSLNKAARPHLTSQSSQSSMRGGMSSGGQPDVPAAPTSAPIDGHLLAPTASNTSTPGEMIIEDAQPNPDDPLIKTYILPLALKNKDRWEDKHNPQLIVKAKYLPYQALRQQFWRAMLKQYDADENARVSKVELTTMLDTLGSTLKESTIDGFFKRFSSGMEMSDPLMTYDQTVMCLEDQLQKSMTHKSWSDRIRTHTNHASSRMAAMHGQKDRSDTGAPLTTTDSQNTRPIASETNAQDVPAVAQDRTGAAGEEGDFLDDDLTDERGEEHVVEIRECPLCHQPRLNKKSDADIITHIATCASSDWRSVNNLVMAGFVTSSQAQRKWYSKVITKISYGGYKLGANSANTLVQDRITGQINEERMSVYVRIGIRLLYKGLKSRDMEKKRIRKMLRNMSLKQGKKFDDPASARQIQDFINFHQLDMSEVLKPTDQFKNFNEFFYRQLKPTARPCSAPNNPKIIVSPADCRSVVFNTIDEAQKIWVKGRGFSMSTLLGDAYPEDVKRFSGGSLGICRLAPQDYHRFHIPVDGVMGKPKLIEGEYYTVNPMAIRSALDVYGENIRVCVPIDSVAHGRVMVICVGAMMVGSTVITRTEGEKVRRAEELGYFQFGGSTILLLFEPGAMQYDDDIVDNSNGAVETLLRVGMSIGHSPEQSQYAPDMRKQEENITEEERDEAKRRIEGSLNAPDRYNGPEVAIPTERLPSPATDRDISFRTTPTHNTAHAIASMTAHVTRAPLQLIQNPHIMTDAQRNGRRHSSRLADKEDTPLTNGYEPVKASHKAPSGATKAVKSTKAGGKRKAAYDEVVDDFAFTRTRSKKQKPEPTQPPLTEESIAPPPQRHAEPAPVTQKKSKQRFEDSPVTGIAEQKPAATKPRRSTRNSGGSQEGADPPPLAVKKRRKGRDSEEQPRVSGRTKDTQHTDGGQGQPRGDGQEGEQDHTHPVEITFDATKIALPFADTPIIRRNQEMRKGIASGHGKRRSSLGMRGRRASSLIDTGKSNALPHDSVETADFYKHIESEGLPEPRRMKQLLTWCGTRALGEKPPSVKGEDQHAVLAAREIQSQLLKDFPTKSSLSDWFDRMEEPAKPSPPKANPKNQANQAKIVELEEQLARLKTERESWASLLSPKSSYQQSASLSLPPIPTPSNPPDPSAIVSSLLPPDQQSILECLLPPSSSAPTDPTTSSTPASTSLRDRTSRRLHTLTKDLEFTIDSFATNVHALQSYKDVAGRLANDALANCAEVLEERDRQSTIRAAGEGQDGEPPVASGEMRTVLRGLSRVIDD